jgi:hypothetical protein
LVVSHVTHGIWEKIESVILHSVLLKIQSKGKSKVILDMALRNHSAIFTWKIVVCKDEIMMALEFRKTFCYQMKVGESCTCMMFIDWE